MYKTTIIHCKLPIKDPSLDLKITIKHLIFILNYRAFSSWFLQFIKTILTWSSWRFITVVTTNNIPVQLSSQFHNRFVDSKHFRAKVCCSRRRTQQVGKQEPVSNVAQFTVRFCYTNITQCRDIRATNTNGGAGDKSEIQKTSVWFCGSKHFIFI